MANPNRSIQKRDEDAEIEKTGATDLETSKRHQIPTKINLIPFNEWSDAPYKRFSNNRIRAFANIIYQVRYGSPIRTPRGEDIMGACGQLKSATERARKSREEIAAEAGFTS